MARRNGALNSRSVFALAIGVIVSVAIALLYSLYILGVFSNGRSDANVQSAVTVMPNGKEITTKLSPLNDASVINRNAATGTQSSDHTNLGQSKTNTESLNTSQLGDPLKLAQTPVGNAVPLRILQIGDSHTAADFFTGEARRLLQDRFGDGGPGYLEVGKPHAGIRNSAVTISASPGWTYTSLQKSADHTLFYLSGFNATATKADETLTYSSDTPVMIDLVEIELTFGPAEGAIEIRIDDLQPVRRSLISGQTERLVLRMSINDVHPLKTLQITTLNNSSVTVSSVGLFNTKAGLSLSRIGFPGATVDILNRLEPDIVSDTLKRLAPHIVILAFGTNEGFDDNLDLTQYKARYLSVVSKIRTALPQVKLVLIAPPQGTRTKGHANLTPGEIECGDRTPPNLNTVRQSIRDLARRDELAVWDWSAIMPETCGTKEWNSATPKLMADDRVHLTKAGYELSAKAFTAFLEPIVTQRAGDERLALSNH